MPKHFLTLLTPLLVELLSSVYEDFRRDVETGEGLWRKLGLQCGAGSTRDRLRLPEWPHFHCRKLMPLHSFGQVWTRLRERLHEFHE